MAEINDIRPSPPVFPKRPTDRVEKKRGQTERDPRHEPHDKRDEDDDGRPHVDEYA